MVLTLRNATETCPLLEKFALHEPKVFFENGADRAPSSLEKIYFIMDCRRNNRFDPIWGRAVDRLASLSHGEFSS